MDFPILLTSQLREHLRALRKTRGLTQAALGQLLGVGQARVAEIESNPGAVSIDQLMKVVSALRASLVLRDGVPAVAANHADAVAPTSTKTNKTRKPGNNAAARATPASGRIPVIHPKKGSW